MEAKLRLLVIAEALFDPKDLIWPATTLIGLVIFCLLFRGPIAAVLAKLKTVPTPFGDMTVANAIDQHTGTAPNRAVSSLSMIFDSQVITETVQRIRNDPLLRSETDPAVREETLIRLLARLQHAHTFERVYHQIFGSQLDCLRLLAGAQGVTDESSVRRIFDTAVEAFPDWHKDRSFEEWARFLETLGLIQRPQGGFAITPVGTEFMKYLFDQRLPQQKYG